MLDCALLALSLHAAKAPFSIKNLLLSSLFGALFALLFPLLSLSAFWGFSLKICAGFLMCFLVFPHLKSKKHRSMYAFVCFFFFCFSFAFAGACFALFSQNLWENSTQQIPFSIVFSLFVFLCLCAKKAVAKLYQKKRVFQHIYNCAIPCNKRLVAVLGFLDSGNKATKNNLPVCFISPLIAYELWQENILQNGKKNEKRTEQVCNELTIHTVSGEKTFQLQLGELHIEHNNVWIKKQVYFAISPHIISQTYDLLLSANILEENA